MSKQLLTDVMPVRFQIQEDNANTGRLVARGEFARADVPTANRRVYPSRIWKKQIQKIQEDMVKRRTLGELDHPSDGKTKLQRVSHVITGLEIQEDGTVVGELEVIEGTPNGDTLAAIIRSNCEVGVSSRGYGSVRQDAEGNDVVQDDFNFMTFDAVADPAVTSSYPKFEREQAPHNAEKDDLNYESVKPKDKTLNENIVQEDVAVATAKKLLLDYDIPFEDIFRRGIDIFVMFAKEKFADKFSKLLKVYGAKDIEKSRAGEGKFSTKWVVSSELPEQEMESLKKVCEAWDENDDEENPNFDPNEGYEDDAFLMQHIVFDFFGKERSKPIPEMNVDFPLDRLYELEKKGLVTIEKGLVIPTDAGRDLVRKGVEEQASPGDTEYRQTYLANMKSQIEKAKKSSPGDVADLDKTMKDTAKKWGLDPNLVKAAESIEEGEAIHVLRNKDDKKVLSSGSKADMEDELSGLPDPENYEVVKAPKGYRSKDWSMKESREAVYAKVIAEVEPVLRERIQMEFEEAYTQKVQGVLQENQKLQEQVNTVGGVAKNLGFNLYLERNLSTHPRFAEIRESLHDFSKIDDFDDLKRIVSPYLEEAKRAEARKASESKAEATKHQERIARLENQVAELAESKKQLQESVVKYEKSIAGLNNRVLLEKKLLGHPRAIEIRKLYESRNPESVEEVQTIVESFRERIQESPIYESVREGLRRRKLPSNIVEESVKHTRPKEKSFRVGPVNIDINEYRMLSGVKVE